MKQILSGFGLITGASYPFRVLQVFLQNSYLWGYLITPILLNLILGITIYASSLFLGWQLVQKWLLSLSNWLDNLLINSPSWLGILDYLVIALDFLVHLLLIVGLLVITGFLLVQFGVLLGAFWYGQLSEQLEKLKTGKVETIEMGIIRDINRAIFFEIKKLILIIIGGVICLLLNFLPLVGTLFATIGGIIVTATLICIDFLDSPLERRRFSFRKKLSLILTSLPASAGFSLVCLGLISIPLLNLLTIPLCVASGTLFFCDRILPELSDT
jgi:CysZ protein